MNDWFHFTAASLSALLMFSFVSSITPGPNNLMLLYSGARFGFNHSLPHLLGVSLGFGFMLILCCLGVAAVFWQIPHAQDALKIVGCAYMLWLAYKLWKNGTLPANGELPDAKNKGAAKPFTLMQAALFQYVNPKAWMMGLTVPAAYLPNNGHIVVNTLIASAFFTVVNLFCCGTWVQGGVTLQKLMHKPKLAQWINWIIVAMTVYCAAAVWL